MTLFERIAAGMIRGTAARKWGVPVEELTTEPSVVVHAKSGRKLTYGDIAAIAEIPEKAPEIKPDQLKKSKDFRLIGKDVMRVELPNKVNGTATYSIDLQIPGMIYGAMVQSPVEGGTPDEFDEAAVQAVPGVISTARLPYGVGVLAQTAWAAFTGKAALEQSISWNRTGKAWGFNSEHALASFAAAARDISQPTKLWAKNGDAPAALQTAAMAGRGSTAPVLTLPAVPTARSGRSPDAASAASCRPSAVTSMRRFRSVGIHRMASVPRPLRSAAL